jgi:5'-3' exonuclease
MVLDSASLYFRAFYGVPVTSRGPHGEPTNALKGMLDFIARLVTDHEPSDLIAAWDDDWRPDFRVTAIPTYKAHRVEESAGEDVEEIPDELSPQVPLIETALELMGITRMGVPGYEADDVIGSVVTQTQVPCMVVTGDRDLFQLVDDERPVRVLYTASKGVGNAEIIDNAALVDRYGVTGEQYGDYALLRGDSSDGLPGVRGIGEKTAAALISRFGTLDALIAAAQAGDPGIKPAAARNILASTDYITAARKVVPVVCSLDIDLTATQLPRRPRDAEALAAFATRWGVENSVRRVGQALGW